MCPDNAEKVGDMIVAGQRELPPGQLTLVEFAEFVDTMLSEAERSGGIPQMSDCSEPFALAVIALKAS